MIEFAVSTEVLREEILREKEKKIPPHCGARASFEGRVRNRNEGAEVLSLEYSCYRELALKEGRKILEETRALYRTDYLYTVHRIGHLEIGETAIFILAAAEHSEEAFRACSHCLKQMKERLPVWKKEHYSRRESRWLEPGRGKDS